jgi:hemerythrin-like metal-binding protein
MLTQPEGIAMQPMPWKEQYSVGVKEIDREHRGLLDIINQITTSFEKKDEWQSTSVIIDSLIHYAYNHFATEERYMIEAEYPELSWHIGLHLAFMRKLFLMSEDYKQHGLALQKEILTFLVSWFSSHVLEIDRKYMSYMEKKGIK